MPVKLLRAAFQQAAAPRYTPVELPGIGRVFVKELTVGEVNAHRDEDEAGIDLGRSLARILYASEEGEREPAYRRLFDPDNADDVALLNRLPARVLRCLNEATPEKN